MSKIKYYVVWQGRKTGILKSWEECKASVLGFKNAKYKSFKTLALAKKAYLESSNDYIGISTSGSHLSNDNNKLIAPPNLDTISVDAACSGNPGPMEYQGVDTRTKEVLFIEGPFENSTNNIGEFLALVHGLAYLKKNNDKRPIYSDSKIAMGWVRDKTARTYLDKTEFNKKSFELIERAIRWLKNNEFDNSIIKWETKEWGEIPADFGRK